jgi:hypothetical protein
MALTQTDEEFDFAEWLQEFGCGATNRKLGQVLRETVAACRETGKKGSITLKISVGAGSEHAQLAADIKVTRPEPSLPGGSYYVREDGGLVEENPKQTKFPARVLEALPIKRSDGGAS